MTHGLYGIWTQKFVNVLLWKVQGDQTKPVLTEKSWLVMLKCLQQLIQF